MASPYKSEDTQLLVGSEATQGTSVAPTRVLGQVADDATPPDPTQNWIVQRVIGGDREAFQQEQTTREYQSGDVPVVLQDGAPVAYALGADSVTGTAAPYTHTITAKQNDIPPSQTLEVAYFGRGGGTDMVRTFSGCVPNSMDLSMNNDDQLTATLEYWAMGVSLGSTPTTGVSVPSTRPWLFSDASSQLSLFGTSFARFEDFTLSIQNNLVEGRYIAPAADHPSGSARDPFDLTYGNAEYELDATLAIEDSALYSELTTPTSGGFTATIAFQRGGSGNSFTITCTGCQITEAPHTVPGDASKIEVDVTIVPSSVSIAVEDDSAATAYV